MKRAGRAYAKSSDIARVLWDLGFNQHYVEHESPHVYSILNRVYHSWIPLVENPGAFLYSGVVAEQ